jgi:hypothetical protein
MALSRGQDQTRGTQIAIAAAVPPIIQSPS